MREKLLRPLLSPPELHQFAKETFEALKRGVPAEILRKGAMKRGDKNLILMTDQIITMFEKRSRQALSSDSPEHQNRE